MDALLNPQTGGYVVNQSAQSIENELYIRLVTPLGSYWADRTLGSRLHELRRQKHVKRIEVLAKQYAEQALQPVIQSKRAQSIQVTASAPRHGWLKLHIEAVDAAGDNRIYLTGNPVITTPILKAPIGTVSTSQWGEQWVQRSTDPNTPNWVKTFN